MKRHLEEMAMTFVIVATLLTACTKGETLRAAETTLTTIQVTTDIMWAAAMEARLAEQRIYVESLERMSPEQRPTLAEVEARLREIQERWEPRYAGFRAVRRAHALAVEAYEAYRDDKVDLQVLLDALNHVIALYQEIKAMMPTTFEADAPPEKV